MPTAVATRQVLPPAPVVCQRVTRLQSNDSAIKCLFQDGNSLTLSRFLARSISPADQIEFDPTAVDPARELRLLQPSGRRPRELYFA